MGSVFLSYAGADRETATRVREGLEAAGLHVWQDTEGIKVGDNWVDKLQEALVSCSAYVILVGVSGISFWINQELSYAQKRRGESNGLFTIFPLLLPGVEPEDLPPFLATIQAKRLAAEPTPEDYRLLAEQISSGEDELPEEGKPNDLCPFVGLESFDEDSAAFFFGRQAEIPEALALFGHPGKGAERRWLQVEGPSGVGKSSLVKAGIIPAIRKGWTDERRGWPARNWRIAIMRPGNDPVLNMAEALTRAFRELTGGSGLSDIKKRLRVDDPEVLRDLIREYLPKKSRFLLVLDQLEEAFTLIKDANSRKRLDTLVASALEDRDGRFYLITTVRSDFILRFGELPQLESLLNQRAERYYLKPIGERGLRDVVFNPMRRAGLKWDEPTLGERIVKSAAGESNALPLVSKLLWLLWQRRAGNKLLARVYEELGGVGGALARSADELLDSLGKNGKRRARDLLLRLVRISHDSHPTRRTISRTTALGAAGGGAEAERVLNRLAGGTDAESPADMAGARLIVISAREMEQADVDLAHETLLTHWGTLHKWIDEHRDQLFAEEALEETAENWRDAGKPRLPGVPARSLLKRYRSAGTPSELAAEYLRAVRIQSVLQSINASLVLTVILGTIAFGVWINRREDISIRSGFYLLLALTDIYYLQPAMVKVLPGRFLMGSHDPESPSSESESDSCGSRQQGYPKHEVVVNEAFHIGKYEVTFDEYDIFAQYSDQVDTPRDNGWGRGSRPVINVSWEDAVAYAQWLSAKTGKSYRLPTEAEWEYAARATSTTAYWWGPEMVAGKANCGDCGNRQEDGSEERKTVLVGSFPANKFGLHDTTGNVWEWVQDCWHKPEDGTSYDLSAWEKPECSRRVLRGGAWDSDRCHVRSATRHWSSIGFESAGFRLVR